jgi:hypothetical protein
VTVSSTAVFNQPSSGGQASDGIFKNFEADSVKNGYEGYSIQQNKPWYFYLQYDSRYKISVWDQNGGVVSPVGPVQRQKTEDLIRFYGAGANTHELAWILDGTPDYTWFDDKAVRSFALAGRKITVSLESCPTCLTVTYNFTAMQYKYTPPVTDLVDQDDKYPVAIRFSLELI